MSVPFVAISLGWGVQSWTLAAMSALGELPPVDVAIHADTMHEASGTYAHAAKWTPWLEERGVKVVTVGDAKQVAKVTTYKTDIPAFTKAELELPCGYTEYDDGDNAYFIETGGTYTELKKGMLRRQCTHRWKVIPIRRWIQKHRNKRSVEQWIGITTDEALRMKPSDVKYITHRWPLIEKRFSRQTCIAWLNIHGLDIPPKSSCVFCPYHDSATWREMKLSGNGDWAKAVEVDRAIRKARPPYDLFVHSARIPLEDVDLRNLEDRGQLRLWDEECSGMCGL